MHLPFLSATVCVLGMSAVCAAQEDSTLKERFLREAPPKWEQYNAFAKTLQGSCRGELNNYLGEGHQKKRLTIIKRNDRCSLLQFESLSAGGKAVWAVNPQYGFELGDHGKGWVLTTIDFNKEPFVGGRTVSEEVRQFPLSHFKAGRPLSELINDPNFKITLAETHVADGHEFVRIGFECPCPFSQEPYHSHQKGTLLFDPAHYWCIKEAELHRKMEQYNDIVHRVCEYKEGSRMFPIPTRVSYTYWGDSTDPKKLVEKDVYEMDLEEVVRPPGDEEFTLTAFGLPEPRGVVWPSKSNWWLYIIVFGLLSLVIGSYFFRRVLQAKGEGARTSTTE